MAETLCRVAICHVELVKGLCLWGRGSRFLDFRIFEFLNIFWQNNSKTKVEKVFFFLFMSSSMRK
jgi:hypothetical protein